MQRLAAGSSEAEREWARLQNADSVRLFEDLSHYLRNDTMSLFTARLVRHYEKSLKPFVAQVHKKFLFDQLSPNAWRLTTEEFARQKAKHLSSRKTRDDIEPALTCLYDALYANDLRELNPNFKAYLAATFAEKWNNCGMKEEKRHDVVRRMIADVLLVNRYMLRERGESLIRVIERYVGTDTADEGKQYLAHCVRSAVGGPGTDRVKKALALYISFIVSGPERWIPSDEDLDARLYVMRRAATRTGGLDSASLLSAQAGSGHAGQIAAPGDGAVWRAEKEALLFKNGAAERLSHPIDLISWPERIMIRCAGNPEPFRAPFLHFHQLNSECLAYALSVFLLKGRYDLSVRPIALRQYKLAERAYWSERGLRGAATETPEALEQSGRALLKQLQGDKSPVSLELLRYVAREVDANPDHPEGEMAQVSYYLRVLDMPALPLLLRGGTALQRSRDWDVLRALLDNPGGSINYALVYRKCSGISGGHGTTWLRDVEDRNWYESDSNKSYVPVRQTPGSAINDLLRRGLSDECEVLIHDQPQDGDEASTRAINGALRFYQEELCATRFDHASAVLDSFLGAKIGKWVLFQYVASDREHGIADDALPLCLGPGGESDARDIELSDLAGFIDDVAGGIVTALNRQSWNSLRGAQNDDESSDEDDDDDEASRIAASVAGLEARLNSQSGVERVVLSGWNASPYFVVARKGRDGTWGIAREDDIGLSSVEEKRLDAIAPGAPRPLAAFFRQLALPAGAPALTRTYLEVMFWMRSARSEDWRGAMARKADAASEKVVGRLVKYLHDEEEGLVLEREMIRALEEDCDPLVSQPDADNESLFGGPTPLHTPRVSPQPQSQPESRQEQLQSQHAVDGSNIGEAGADLDANADVAYLGTQAERGAAKRATDQLERALAGANIGTEVPVPGARAPALGRPGVRKALGRVTQLDVSGKLVLGKRNLVEMINAGRVQIEPPDAEGDAILVQIAELAERDPRFRHFLTSDDQAANLESITQGVRDGLRFWAKAFDHHIVSLVMPLPTFEEDDNGVLQQERLPMIAVLKRIPDREAVKLIALGEHKQAVLDEMDLKYGPLERWKVRPLHVAAKRAEDMLPELRDEFGLPMPAFLRDAQTLCNALQTGLLRVGNQRPDRLASSVWRVTVTHARQDYSLLINLRGTRVFNVRRDVPVRRDEAIDEAVRRRRRDVRIAALAWRRDLQQGEAMERLRRHLNQTQRGAFVGPFDMFHAIANSSELDDVPGSPHAHLKQLMVHIDDEAPSSFLVLFDNGEPIDVRADDGTGARRAEMLRYAVKPALVSRFNKIARQVRRDGYRDVPPGSTEALVQLLFEHAAIHGLNSAEALLHALIVRGSGEVVHEDYPDLRRHKLALSRHGASGETLQREVDVLVRSSDGLHLEEIQMDRTANRARLLAYHFPEQDRVRLFKRDRDPRNRVPGYEHGPIAHVAKVEHISRHEPGEDEPDPERADQIGFVRQTVARHKATPIHQAYPEIGVYRTEVPDGGGAQPLRFLARVRHSAIVEMHANSLANFMQMLWKRPDIGVHLPRLKAVLGNERFNVPSLRALLQPQMMEEELPDPAYPSWRRFEAGELFVGDTMLGKLRDGKVVELIDDSIESFDAVRRYRIPLTRYEHIVGVDKRNGNFLDRHRGWGQSRMDYVRQHVRRENGTDVEGWPQLRTFTVPSRRGGTVQILARIEDGEIWDVMEEGEPARRKLTKAVIRERMEDFRRISRTEAQRISQEAVPFVVASLLERQRRMDNDRTRATELAKSQSAVIRRIARRENRAEMEYMGRPAELRQRAYETLASLGGDVTDLLQGLIDDDDWEAVPNRPDMRSYDPGVRDDEGQPLKIYAYFNTFGELVDARIGRDSGLELLESVRRKNLDSLQTAAGNWFSDAEVREIYLRDHTMRDKKLMQLADLLHINFPDLLNSAIAKPRIDANGNWQFPGGRMILTDQRSGSELFRRYTVERGPGEPEAQLDVVFAPIYGEDGQWTDMRLADVRMAPALRQEGHDIDLPLLAAIRFLEQYEAEVEMPDLAPQELLMPQTPPNSPPHSPPASDGGGDDEDDGGGLDPDPDGDQEMPDANNGDAPDFDDFFNPDLFDDSLFFGDGFQDDWFADLDLGLLDANPNADNDAAADPMPDPMPDTGQTEEEGEESLFVQEENDPDDPAAFNFDNDVNALLNGLDGLDGFDGIDLDAFNNPFIFRVELPPPPVLEDFLPGLRDKFGKPAYTNLLDKLCPDGSADKFNQRLQRWLQSLAVPSRDSEAERGTPGLRRIVTPLFDKFNNPVTVLGQLKEGKLIGPWNDTEENKAYLIEKIKRESPEPDDGGKKARLLRRMLTAEQASRFADGVTLGDAQLDVLFTYLLGDALRESVLAAICKRNGDEEIPSDMARVRANLRHTLIEGLREQLIGAMPWRPIVIPTGAVWLGQAVGLHLLLGRGGVRRFWVPDPVAHGEEKKAVRDAILLEEEMRLGELPLSLSRGDEAESGKKTGKNKVKAVPDGFISSKRNLARRGPNRAAVLTEPVRRRAPVRRAPRRDDISAGDPEQSATAREILAHRAELRLKRKRFEEELALTSSKRIRGNARLAAARIPARPVREVSDDSYDEESDAASAQSDDSLFLPDKKPRTGGMGQRYAAWLKARRRTEESTDESTAEDSEEDAYVPAAGTQAAAMANVKLVRRRPIRIGGATADGDAVGLPNRARGGKTAERLRAALSGRDQIFDDAVVQDMAPPILRDQTLSDLVHQEIFDPDLFEEGLLDDFPRLEELDFLAPLLPGQPQSASVPYSFERAKGHWTGERAEEFDPIWRAWNEFNGTQKGPTTFLMHLSALCDERVATGLGERVDLENKIYEFEVEPYPGAQPFKLWRLVDNLDSVSLRLAPPEGNRERRDALMQTMYASIMQRNVQPIEAVTPYPIKLAHHHWYSVRHEEFAFYFSEWNEHSGVLRSGGAFLQQVSAQCDASDEHGMFTVVNEQYGIREYEIASHRKAFPMRVWRMVDENGVDLRLVPIDGTEESRRKLEKEMLEASASKAGLDLFRIKTRVDYDSKAAGSHWGGSRKAEFARYYEAWVKRVGMRSGGAFLMLLSKLCDESEPIGQVQGEARITHYRITLHPDEAPIEVWRLLDTNGVINIRLAAKGKRQADRLVYDMLDEASRTVKMRARTQKATPYTPFMAKAHWAGERKKELQSKLDTWNDDQEKQASGPSFLSYLYNICDTEDRAGNGVQIDDEGRIFEFEIVTHPDAEPFKVWRLNAENVNIRLAPDEDDERGRTQLIGHMLRTTFNSASRQFLIDESAIGYTKDAAGAHWTKIRIAELDDKRVAFSKAIKVACSGPAFLLHLSALCDEKAARQDPGVRAIGKSGKIQEFAIDTLAGVAPFKLWRLVDVGYSISLRLAPGDDDERDILEKSMLSVAKNTVSRLDGKARGKAADAPKLRRWNGTRAADFEPIRQAWNRHTGAEQSGMMLLMEIEAQYRVASAGGTGDIDDMDDFSDAGETDGIEQVGEDEKISEFSVALPGVPPLRAWRLEDGSGTVDLQLAPGENDIKKRAVLEAAMLRAARNSAANTKKGAAPRVVPVINFPNTSAKTQWRGERVTEFSEWFAAWNASNDKEMSGGQFLMHLSALCDSQAHATNHGTVDAKSVVTWYELRTDFYPEPLHILRLHDEIGSVILRRRSENEAERKKAISTMLNVSAVSIGKYRKKKAGK